MIKETSIRPERLMAECKMLHMQDIKEIFTDAGCFIQVDCPNCKNKDHAFAYKKGLFDFSKCSRCGTVFINPRPSVKQLNDFYTNSRCLKYWAEKIYPQTEAVRVENIIKPRVKKVMELCALRQPVDMMVEIGAGYGWFAGLAVQEGLCIKAIAIEPQPELAAKCATFHGVDVVECLVEDWSEGCSAADLVVCFELMEHVFSPSDLVSEMYRILKPGGQLILSTPNYEGFDISILGSRSDNVVGPNHLNYFTASTVHLLLENAGFNGVDICTPGELDVTIIKGMIQRGDICQEELPFFGKMIAESGPDVLSDFQKFLQRWNFSSNMMIIATK